MGIVNVPEHMNRALERYQAGTDRREKRKRLVARVRARKGDVDLGEIDDPQRMVQRLLKMDDHGAADRFVKGLLDKDGAHARDESLEDIFRERIIKKNDLKQVNYLDKALQASRSVGRILTKNGNQTSFGTGFMVSPRLMMTNHHVLPNFGAATRSEIQFNYREISPGTNTRPVVFKLDPDAFFVNDKHLDYALVAIVGVNEEQQRVEERGWIHLIEESGKAIVGERVNIIQHPEGEPLQLCLHDNFIVDKDDDFLIYESDTKRGSSGSPVFNDQWQLAALHHTGVPRKNEEGQILMVDGKPWNKDRRTIGMIDWRANEGARVSKIITSLRTKAKAFDEDQQAFFQGLFQRQPELTLQESATSSSFVRAIHTDEHGFVSLTVPVTIKVGLNQAGIQSITLPAGDADQDS